jgi:predicted N-formylglutamate amidohydrolase
MSMVTNEAVEIVSGEIDAPIVMSCEHASERMPPGYAWPDADRWLAGTHWAFDLGAADLARELATSVRASLVLSRYTRLLVDPNRSEDSPSLIRTVAEGQAVQLNAHVTDTERMRRIETMHRPFHAALDHAVSLSSAPILFSIHTFTPLYEGQKRELEIGVLFDEEEALAVELNDFLAQENLHTALNEPYSGREGLIYSADRHAKKHGRRPLELEVRQDLATDPAFRVRLVPLLTRFFRR